MSGEPKSEESGLPSQGGADEAFTSGPGSSPFRSRRCIGCGATTDTVPPICDECRRWVRRARLLFRLTVAVLVLSAIAMWVAR